MGNNLTKLKILQVHNYYRIPGGEDTVVANEKQILERNGHLVIQYTKKNSDLNGLKQILYLKNFMFSFETYRDVKNLIKENNINIVHVHNTLALISPAVYYAAFSCGIPVVQTVHNFRFICPGATLCRNNVICEKCLHDGLKNALRYSCYKNSKIISAASVISLKFYRKIGLYSRLFYICLTEFNKEKLLSLEQIKPETVYVKPNFVIENSGSFVPFSERKNQYIFVGRLDKLKGIDLLLQAWRKLGPQFSTLLIFGTGSLTDWCQEYISQHNLVNVRLCGYVDNTIILKRIKESRALILPTQCYEGFPMSIIEAYSVGTPVIGSDFGNVGNIIKNGVTGWKFNHKNIDSIIKCLKSNLDLEETVYTYYLTHYSSNSNYKMLIDIYKDIINAK